jgi:hypothetical protein
MLWQGAKWRILKNFNVQNEECHNYDNNQQREKRLTPTRGIAPLTCELWQVWCSVTFSDLWSQHCEGSLKNSCHSFCVTFRDWRKTSCQMVNSDHIEARMRYCILHRLYPASRFDWDDITVIKSGQDFSRNKTDVLLEEGST